MTTTPHNVRTLDADNGLALSSGVLSGAGTVQTNTGDSLTFDDGTLTPGSGPGIMTLAICAAHPSGFLDWRVQIPKLRGSAGLGRMGVIG